jgi:hypothetical protein
VTRHEDEKHDNDLAAHFYAALMGFTIAEGPPSPDSMLAWLLANDGATPEDIRAEHRRRGVVFDPNDVFFYDARHPERTIVPG